MSYRNQTFEISSTADETNLCKTGTTDDYTVHRILRGVPEGALELAGTLPLNSNLDLMGGSMYDPRTLQWDGTDEYFS
jgi:hypothetical protein